MAKVTKYLAGQRWAFNCSLAEFEHTLVIGLVLSDYNPTEYSVYVRYNPEAGIWIPPGVDGVRLTLTADGLDRSVTELIEPDATLPHWWGFGQKEDLPDRPRTLTSMFCEEVDKGVRSGSLRASNRAAS